MPISFPSTGFTSPSRASLCQNQPLPLRQGRQQLSTAPVRDTFWPVFGANPQQERTRKLLALETLLETSLKDKRRWIPQPPVFNGPDKVLETPMNCYARVPLSTPVYTYGIYNCVGLGIIDKKQGIHYLSHLSGEESIESLKESLQGLDLKNSDIYLQAESHQLATHKALAILMDKGVANRVKFIEGRHHSTMLLANGNVYLPNEEKTTPVDSPQVLVHSTDTNISTWLDYDWLDKLTF